MIANFKLKKPHCCRRSSDYGTENILPRVMRGGITYDENVRENFKRGSVLQKWRDAKDEGYGIGLLNTSTS